MVSASAVGWESSGVRVDQGSIRMAVGAHVPGDRRYQFDHVDRFDYMLDHAGFKTAPPNFEQRMRCQSDDRQLRMHGTGASGHGARPRAFWQPSMTEW